MYLLGVDAGNSKTIAAVAKLDGQIIGIARRPCGDISNGQIGAAQALENIKLAIDDALDLANLSPADITGKGFSLAGADWPEDFAYLRAELDKHPASKGATIVNDALGALRASSASGEGVAVVCGTYAVTAARFGGKTWVSSYWQETGGGYQLGSCALRAVYRAELGIDPPTALTEVVMSHFQAPTVEAVLHKLTARATPNLAPILDSDIARLAPKVLSTAEQGDSIAASIVNKQAAIMADYAFAAADKVGLSSQVLGTQRLEVYLIGGVFQHASSLLHKFLTEAIHAQHKHAKISLCRTQPIVGALLLAFEQAFDDQAAPYQRLCQSLAEQTS